MKKKDEIKKYRNMKESDLRKGAADIKKQAILAVLKIKAGKSNTNSDAKKNKKSLARILTVLNTAGDTNG